MTMKLKNSVLSAAVALSAASLNANAQLEEVIVTAQRHAQSVNDVGVTMNAFTGDRLKELNVRSTEDIALHTPGLTVNSVAATGVPIYTIRGVGFQDYSVGASSTVGLYFDEVALPYTVMSRGAIFDVERVEVLKGPQGDLYGRNTTGGSINFISNKPSDEFEAGISASYGNYETADVEGWVGGPITDSARGRLAFRTVQAGEGWQESLTRNDKLGEKDVTAVRGIVDFDLADNVRLELMAHYVKDESDNQATVAYDGTLVGLGEFNSPYVGLEQYLGTGTPPPWYSTGDAKAADWTNSAISYRGGVAREVDLRPQRDNELKGFTGKLEFDVGDITVTSITSYNEFERKEANDWDGGYYNDSSNINTSEIEVFSQEIRFSKQTDNLLWIAGLYYSDDEVDEWYNYFMSDSVYGNGSVVFGVSPFQFAPILELDTIYHQETESYAAFGHVEWEFAPQFRLTLGLRYTEEERDWEGCTYDAQDGSLSGFLNFAFGASLQPGDCGTVDDLPGSPTNFITLITTGGNVNDAFHPYVDSIETEKWMGKVTLDYNFSDDVLGYATISSGFKSGGFNGANSNALTQLIPYTEEELLSYEIGIKSTLLNGAMQLNAAAFYYDYTDKQENDVAVTLVGNISGLTNVDESEIYGAELDLSWAPSEGWFIGLGVAWLDTEVTEWDAVDRDTSSWPNNINYYDASGVELAQSPEWSVNGSISYEWAISNSLNMSIAADYSYQDKTSGLVEPQSATEDFSVVNGRIAVSSQDDVWRATLWSNNLLDEDYYPAAFTGGNGPYARVMGMPRTYGVRVDYNFQ